MMRRPSPWLLEQARREHFEQAGMACEVIRTQANQPS